MYAEQCPTGDAITIDLLLQIQIVQIRMMEISIIDQNTTLLIMRKLLRNRVVSPAAAAGATAASIPKNNLVRRIKIRGSGPRNSPQPGE
jgi:hypothetical protein